MLLFSQIRFIAPVNDLGGQTEVDVIMIAVFCGWRYWSSFVLFMPKHNLRSVISLGLFSCTPRSLFSTVFWSAQLWWWFCQKNFVFIAGPLADISPLLPLLQHVFCFSGTYCKSLVTCKTCLFESYQMTALQLCTAS